MRSGNLASSPSPAPRRPRGAGASGSPARSRSLYLALLVVLLAGLVLAGSGGGWLLYRSVRAEMDRQLGQRLLSIATTAGQAIGPERFAALVRAEDAAAAARLRSELARTAEANELQGVVLVDSARVVRFDLSARRPEGEVDAVLLLEPELGAVLVSGEPRVTRLVAVEGLRGEYLKTGYAAIEDTTGRILGAIAVEGGSDFFSVLPGMRRRLLWFASAGAGIALVVLVLIARVLRSLVRFEDSLRRAAALAAIGQISALVAHELKNPLAIIRSRSERVRARIEAGKDPREILEWFDAIPAEVDRLDAILTGYLSLARPEAEGEGSARPAAVAHETLELLRPEFERRGLRVETQFEEADELTAAMGARSLRQVLLNLLLNAAQATEAGGVVTVRAQRGPGGVLLEVQDTGRGMDEEERRRALEPFFTTRPAGSGLGLTLVQSLVQARGGSLEIRSAPGRGTRVLLRLPEAGGENTRRGSS